MAYDEISLHAGLSLISCMIGVDGMCCANHWIRSSISEWERKNQSQESKDCVLYSCWGTILGPHQVFWVVFSGSLDTLLLLACSLHPQVSGRPFSGQRAKQRGHATVRNNSGLRSRWDMTDLTSLGRSLLNWSLVLDCLVYATVRSIIIIMVMIQSTHRTFVAMAQLMPAQRCSQAARAKHICKILSTPEITSAIICEFVVILPK